MKIRCPIFSFLRRALNSLCTRKVRTIQKCVRARKARQETNGCLRRWPPREKVCEAGLKKKTTETNRNYVEVLSSGLFARMVLGGCCQRKVEEKMISSYDINECLKVATKPVSPACIKMRVPPSGTFPITLRLQLGQRMRLKLVR